MKNKRISRRRFFGEASCAALGSTALLSSVANMKLWNALAVPTVGANEDYKALVCILLAGGNDSYNMLIPRSGEAYTNYQNTRADLALSSNAVLPISPITSDGVDYGLHPSMSGLQSLFADGNAALVANIGTLIEPIANRTEYYDRIKRRPLGLYSHSDQIQQWQTSVPQSRAAIGWGGRMADILMDMNSNENISMNISLSGRNVFQSGELTMEYTISNEGNGADGIEPISGYGNNGFLNRIRENAVNSLLEDVYSDIFKSTYANLKSDALVAQEEFAAAIAKVPPFADKPNGDAAFGAHYLAQNLRMVAKTIGARQDLGMKRQTFFITFGGWDHHNEVLDNQLYMLGVVSDALKDFYDVLKNDLGIEQNVTAFTVSDFGRTLTSNGQGSDHAWGGNQIIVGGALNGREIYGQYPSLSLNETDNPLNLSDRGALIPTTAVDQYFAEMALWFGVSPNDLSTILPNIGNFYDISSADMPIGFLNRP
ncbi:MAG: DUF1501 domain-containing protein [Bacteroidota bacterium]